MNSLATFALSLRDCSELRRAGRKLRRDWLKFQASSERPARKPLAWALLGLALPLLPVMALNSWRSGAPAFISSNAPINLYLGNVHDASGVVASATPTYERLKAKGPPGEIDLLAELRRDIVAHPGAFARLQVEKLAAFFHPRELPNNLSFDMARKVNPSLRAGLLGWGLLLPWAAAGLVLGACHRRRIVLPATLLLTLVAATVPFFVPGRLRLAAAVPLLLLAAVAVDVLLELWRRGRGRLALAVALAALLTGLLLDPSVTLHRGADYQMAAAAEVSAGDDAARRNDFKAAWRRYARAVALDPEHRAALDRLAAIDRPPPTLAPEAAELCQQGQQAAQRGDYREAIARLQEASRLAPEHPTPRHYLANVYMLQGRAREAMESLEEAVERHPRSELLRQNLQALRQ